MYKLIILTFADRLRIDGGNNDMEGRAMFFSNGVWGTICDADFTETGWPDVFCKELGYDHCQLARVITTSNSISLRYPNIGTLDYQWLPIATDESIDRN